MSFTPQTKRFHLVPVEPGQEKETDVVIEQNESGYCDLLFAFDKSCALSIEDDYPQDHAIIAALGFPTTPNREEK